ncbi:MAG: hypothetical protein K0R63_352 [Rickettsiales bacterium]|jgi:hypothetical protein|nr:hypothetical protein [Rickettsiales bacterium]
MVGVNTAAIDIPKFEGRPQISIVSRMRAAAGDPRLSAESSEAIRQGALPPFIAEPEPPQNDNNASNVVSDEEKPFAAKSEAEVDVLLQEITTALSSSPEVFTPSEPGELVDLSV